MRKKKWERKRACAYLSVREREREREREKERREILYQRGGPLKEIIWLEKVVSSKSSKIKITKENVIFKNR